jgi:hypothetical protein
MHIENIDIIRIFSFQSVRFVAEGITKHKDFRGENYLLVDDRATFHCGEAEPEHPDDRPPFIWLFSSCVAGVHYLKHLVEKTRNHV